jgi:hypothetical protein
MESNGMRDILSPWSVFNNTFPFTVSLPLSLPFPHPILCYLPFPVLYLTAMPSILTLAFVIVISIAMTAPATAQRTVTSQVPIIFILVMYLIPIPWSRGQEVTWLVLPAGWYHNLCPEIAATVPSEMLAGALHYSCPVCLRV